MYTFPWEIRRLFLPVVNTALAFLTVLYRARDVSCPEFRSERGVIDYVEIFLRGLLEIAGDGDDCLRRS